MRSGKVAPARDFFDTLYAEAQQLQHLIDDLGSPSLVDAIELPSIIGRLRRERCWSASWAPTKTENQGQSTHAIEH